MQGQGYVAYFLTLSPTKLCVVVVWCGVIGDGVLFSPLHVSRACLTPSDASNLNSLYLYTPTLTLPGTPINSPSTLRGKIHPLFHDWIFPSSSRPSTASSTTSTASSPDPSLIRALTPPLLLASRILTTLGLPWLSEFHIDDIFDESYPGRFPDTTTPEQDQTPTVIPRHHISPTLADPRTKRKWHASTARDLEVKLARQIRWQLDPDMFREKGWVGYTCRHRGEQQEGRPLSSCSGADGGGPTSEEEDASRSKACLSWPSGLGGNGLGGNELGGHGCGKTSEVKREFPSGCCRSRSGSQQMVTLDATLDRSLTIWAGDEAAREKGEKGRLMTVLVMEEYTTRMCELARQGREGGEEYLLTAFMMAVTMLHE